MNFIAFIVVILLSSSREGQTRKNKKFKQEDIANYNKNDDTSHTDSESTSEDTTESIREDISDEILRGNPKKHEYPVESVLTIYMKGQNPNDKEDESQDFKRINFPPMNIMVPESVSKTKMPIRNDSVSEDEEAMGKEILKANALRSAYGDACYRLVLRKCLKAMKMTLKDVCKSRGRKCDKSFNADFKKNAITGCSNQFNDQSAQYRYGKDEPLQTRAQFTDLTRQGYLSMSCLRTLIETEGQSETIDKSKPLKVDADAQNVNILRDRYEKACQKASYEKCRAAGKYATDVTCKKQECITNKKKALKESCKRHCAQSYGYKIKDSSDSDSDGTDSDGTASKSDESKSDSE